MSKQGTRIIRTHNIAPANPNTLEGSLYKEGYSFVPGTIQKFYPRADTRGLVRTGLDPNAQKIKSIVDEKARRQEVNRVTKLKEHYEALLGESLEPESSFYAEVKQTGYGLKDGDNIFNLDSPRQAIDFYWLLETGEIATNLAALQDGQFNPNRTKFYVFDATVETSAAFERKKKINGVIAILDNADALTLRRIQKLVGLGLPVGAGEEEIYNALDEYVRSAPSSLGHDPIERFNSVASLGTELIEVKSLVRDLIDTNIVRLKGEIVMEGEGVLAKSVEEFESYLLDPKNTEIFDSYKDRLRQKAALATF